MNNVIISLIFTFGLNLIVNKTLASEPSGVLQFSNVEHISMVPAYGSQDISISKNLFSREMADSVAFIKFVDSVNKVNHSTISFSVVDTSDNRFDNIQCYMNYSYKNIADCIHVNIHFSNCGSDESPFQNNTISILYNRMNTLNVIKSQCRHASMVTEESL